MIYVTRNTIPYEPRRQKTCLRGFANNKGSDQPAHPRSLISAFVIRYSESNICKPATGELSIIYLVSVAEETGLKLALSVTQKKTGFLVTKPIFVPAFSEKRGRDIIFQFLYYTIPLDRDVI